MAQHAASSILGLTLYYRHLFAVLKAFVYLHFLSIYLLSRQYHPVLSLSHLFCHPLLFFITRYIQAIRRLKAEGNKLMRTVHLMFVPGKAPSQWLYVRFSITLNVNLCRPYCARGTREFCNCRSRKQTILDYSALQSLHFLDHPRKHCHSNKAAT